MKRHCGKGKNRNSGPLSGTFGSGTSVLWYGPMTIGLYGLGFWMPQIVRSLYPSFSNFGIGLVMMVPFIAALLAMLGMECPFRPGRGTDLAHWGCFLFAGGIALVIAGLVQDPLTVFLMLVIATVGIDRFFGPFWTLPAVFLAEAGAAVGFAVINSIGNFGGFIGPACRRRDPVIRLCRYRPCRNRGLPDPLRDPGSGVHRDR